METLAYQPQVALRMQTGTDEIIDREAVFYHTANGYWVAWHQGMAAVLADDAPPEWPCDRVEGAESLAELVSLIESGAYAQSEAYDGDEEAWLRALANEGVCCCGDHCDHPHHG